MPFPECFTAPDEYYATKLHEVYHATGHTSRENRRENKEATLQSRAFEEMRAEMFSMLAGARFNLPMPESNSAAYIQHWNQTFSGGDVKAVFQAASDAARLLTTMDQFAAGEQLRAKWFPRSETWPELIDLQEQRDVAGGVHLRSDARQPVAARDILDPDARPAPLTLAASTSAFQNADDPLAKARVLLQNPELLSMALKQDSDAARSLASLCDAFAQTLNSAVPSQTHTQPVAPTARMRM